MKILLITQWYKPVQSAASNRTSRIAEYWQKKGHDVTVLTGLPSYPTGVLPQKYRRKLYFQEKIDGISILRTYEYPAPNAGVFKRLLNNFSFMFSASIAVRLLPKYDLVIVSSPAFLAGIAGLVASKNKFIFDVRDLWPDSAIELGFTQNHFLITMLKKLERAYYNRADIVTVATPSQREHLIAENYQPDKIWELKNSVDTDFFKPLEVSRKTYELSAFDNDDFIIAFTGNLGAAQGLDITLKAAAKLKKYPKIKFLLVGEGEEKENLMQQKDKLKLGNVIFHSQISREEIRKIINFCDLGNISLKNKKIFQNAIPSKTLEFLSCGKPVIVGVDGYLKKLVIDNQVGISYKPGNADDMAKQILKFYQNKNNRPAGKFCRETALKHFSAQVFYKNLDEILKKLDHDAGRKT